MALGQVPEWLQVNPRDFTAASESGARIGLDAAAQTNQANQEQARLGQSAAEAELNRRQQASESAANQQLEQERMAAQQQEAKTRLQLETQTAARKFQAQQAYQQAVSGGMDPVQAMMQFGPQMGESMSGLGPLALDKFKTQQAALPPQPFMGPDGKPAGVTYGGTAHMFPRATATLPPKISEQDKMLTQHYLDELKEVNRAESSNAEIPDGGTARSLNNRRQQAEAGLKRLGVNLDGSDDKAEDGDGDGAGKTGGLKILSIEQVPATAGTASQ